MKQLQKPKNKFILILVLFLTLVSTGVKDNTFLNLPFVTFANAAFAGPAQQPSQASSKIQDVAQKNVSKSDKAIVEKEEKGGLKQGLFRFLMAMLGVLVSSFVIFLVLKFYQKFVLKKGVSSDEQDFNTLESPKDFKEAINLFLNKTDK